MNLTFQGAIWMWKGPAPWYFVTVPEELCIDIRALADVVTYGWGMIPVTVRIGATTWQTAMWPKDGAYIVPIKASVRKAEKLQVDDLVELELTVG